MNQNKSEWGCELQIKGTAEQTTGIVEEIQNSKDEILDTEEFYTKIKPEISIHSNQPIAPNAFVKEKFDKMYGVKEGNDGYENKILENEPTPSNERLRSISRQSSAYEGRQNALLFLIIVTLIAILIQALYNLLFTA